MVAPMCLRINSWVEFHQFQCFRLIQEEKDILFLFLILLHLPLDDGI